MAPFKSSAGRNLGKLVQSYITSNIGGTITTPAANSAVTGSITATGGNKYTPGNGFIYHAFTGNGIFAQTAGGNTIDVLIVAGGGGGGGGYYAGGGGAGGILEGILAGHQPGSYPVAVGTGGAASLDQAGSAETGGNSAFATVTALGGGKGGSGPGTNEAASLLGGGSGGGKSYYPSPTADVGQALAQPAPDDYTAYGNNAAAARNPGTIGGGGGGAGAVGSSYAGGGGQAFGKWPSSVIPVLTPLNPVMGASNNTYGGGGGGGPAGAGGAGGGGAGGTSSGTAGKDYLGGGGGGSSASGGDGAKGGDGIVLIRYSAT